MRSADETMKSCAQTTGTIAQAPIPTTIPTTKTPSTYLNPPPNKRHHPTTPQQQEHHPNTIHPKHNTTTTTTPTHPSTHPSIHPNQASDAAVEPADDNEEADDADEGGAPKADKSSRASYDYLLSMALWSLTAEKVAALQEDADGAEAEVGGGGALVFFRGGCCCLGAGVALRFPLKPTAFCSRFLHRRFQPAP